MSTLTDMEITVNGFAFYVDVDYKETPPDPGSYWTAPTGPHIESFTILSKGKDITRAALAHMDAGERSEFFHQLNYG